MKPIRTALLALTITIPAVALAQEELGWSGSGEVGYVGARGNTDNQNLRISLEAIHTSESWRNRAFFNALQTSDSGEDTADRFEFGGQSDYKRSDISYWFGSFRYEEDEFSQFDHQATFAAGYGREVIASEAHSLKVEAGIGYRIAEIRSTGEDDDSAIFRGRADYKWTISETAAFTNATLIEAGSDNTFASNVSALETTIRGGLGLNLTYEVRHNTDVDEPVNNTDFVTTVGLVYRFD